MQLTPQIAANMRAPASDAVAAQIKALLQAQNKVVVVLDDDPTGSQTIHDLTVLTEVKDDLVAAELKAGASAFFILTNSRSMTADEAEAIAFSIGEILQRQAALSGKNLLVVYRGDSTLRGYFPHEMYALAKGLGEVGLSQLLIPAFFEGGRITINDVHYMVEGDELIPVGDTVFARDFAFAFTQSNLKHYIEEKTNGAVQHSEVGVIHSELIPHALRSIIMQHHFSIVNADGYAALQTIALNLLVSQTHCMVRSSASFVKAITGNSNKPLLGVNELRSVNNDNGGLIIAGSYVPKTTAQLLHLQNSHPSLYSIEIDVTEIIQGNYDSVAYCAAVNKWLSKGKDVLVYTSRAHVQGGEDAKAGLHYGNKVSDALCALVKNTTATPSFLIAKGGITSSDIATKALGVKKAICLGQALPGVPVWQLQRESKFPAMPYIIFPGNVGDDNALADLYKKLQRP